MVRGKSPGTDSVGSPAEGLPGHILRNAALVRVHRELRRGVHGMEPVSPNRSEPTGLHPQAPEESSKQSGGIRSRVAPP